MLAVIVVALVHFAWAGWNGPATMQVGTLMTNASGWSFTILTTTPTLFQSQGMTCSPSTPCGSVTLSTCEGSLSQGISFPGVTVLVIFAGITDLQFSFSSDNLQEGSCPGSILGFSGTGVTFAWNQATSVVSFFKTSMWPSLIATFTVTGHVCYKCSGAYSERIPLLQ